MGSIIKKIFKVAKEIVEIAEELENCGDKNYKVFDDFLEKLRDEFLLNYSFEEKFLVDDDRFDDFFIKLLVDFYNEKQKIKKGDGELLCFDKKKKDVDFDNKKPNKYVSKNIDETIKHIDELLKDLGE